MGNTKKGDREMKAILVLDEMPCACAECPLHTHVEFDYYYDESICLATGNEILDTTIVNRMCPLKEMPNKMIPEMVIGNRYAEGIVKGWNDCLEEINNG
jgi:hypothetical protein